MSIVKYDIHRTYQLTSVGINQKKKKKKLNEYCEQWKNKIARTAEKKVSNCVWKECVKCFIFDEYNFPESFVKSRFIFIFFSSFVACCVTPFYLETNNEKVMNKFQWFFGIYQHMVARYSLKKL